MGLEHFDTVMSFAVVMLLLSMLVTILVQAVVAVSGLRGWNLQAGVVQLLNQLDPNLSAHAKDLAKAILEHPSLAHMPGLSGRRKATAIRPQELIRVVNELAHNPPAALGASAKEALEAALRTAGAPDSPDLTNRIGTAVLELQKMFPAQAQAVEDAVNRGLTKTNQLERQVSAWFDTVMDRTTDRFILFTRWITAVIAIVLAIGLQVDSIQLFKQLSTHPEVRARLIQSVDATLQQAGEFVADKQRPVAAQAIRAMKDDVTDAREKKLLESVEDDVITRKDGKVWLGEKFMDPARQTEVLAAYEKRFDTAVMQNLKELGASYQQVKSSMDTSGVEIFHQKDATLLGELITGLFLSLGAPFWFNALRQLANLRPAIAGKVEKEKLAVS